MKALLPIQVPKPGHLLPNRNGKNVPSPPGSLPRALTRLLTKRHPCRFSMPSDTGKQETDKNWAECTHETEPEAHAPANGLTLVSFFNWDSVSSLETEQQEGKWKEHRAPNFLHFFPPSSDGEGQTSTRQLLLVQG